MSKFGWWAVWRQTGSTVGDIGLLQAAGLPPGQLRICQAWKNLRVSWPSSRLSSDNQFEILYICVSNVQVKPYNAPNAATQSKIGGRAMFSFHTVRLCYLPADCLINIHTELIVQGDIQCSLLLQRLYIINLSVSPLWIHVSSSAWILVKTFFISPCNIFCLFPLWQFLLRLKL